MEKKQIHTGGATSSKDFGKGDPLRNLKMSFSYVEHKEK
jgi:hypothetical protein